MRSSLNADGTTLSLHDVCDLTDGMVTFDELKAILDQRSRTAIDPVLLVRLAQAFDVDPDFFLTTEGVQDYLAQLRSRREQVVA